jgi:hypothetical protein
MRHIIRGQRWTQVSKRLKGYLGWCKFDTKTIEIAKGQSGERLLDTLCHEYLHAAFRDLDEESVTESATDLARYLIKNGLGFKDECQCGSTTPSESPKGLSSGDSPRKKNPTTNRKRKSPSTKSKASRRRPGSSSTEG